MKTYEYGFKLAWDRSKYDHALAFGKMRAEVLNALRSRDPQKYVIEALNGYQRQPDSDFDLD